MLTAELKKNADEVLDWYLERRTQTLETYGYRFSEIEQLRADRDGQLAVLVTLGTKEPVCGCGRCGR